MQVFVQRIKLLSSRMKVKNMHPLIFLQRFKKNLKTNGLNRWRRVAGPQPKGLQPNCLTKTLLKKHNFTDLQYRRSLTPSLYHPEGFTLIEVIVSLAIMSISIVTILQLFSGGLRSIKISDDYLRAAILAQNKMNELGSKFNIFVNQEGVFEQDDRYHWILSVEDYDLAGLLPQFENLQDENIGKSIFVDKIRLKVFWKTEHGQREVELVTLKTSVAVSPSSKEIMQGKYIASLKIPRQQQFGGQNLPSGQSKSQYIQLNISGVELTVNKQHLCGGTSTQKISGN